MAFQRVFGRKIFVSLVYSVSILNNSLNVLINNNDTNNNKSFLLLIKLGSHPNIFYSTNFFLSVNSAYCSLFT